MLHSGWGLECGGNENFWHFDKKYILGKNRIWMGFHSLIWDDLSERVDHPFVNSITISIVLRKLMSVPCAIPNYLMYLVTNGKYFNHIYINRERIEIKLQLCISHNLPIQNNNLSVSINRFIPIEFTHLSNLSLLDRHREALQIWPMAKIFLSRILSESLTFFVLISWK